MDPLLHPDPQCPLEKIPKSRSPSPNQLPIPTPLPKPPPSGSHDDKASGPDQRSHVAGAPETPGVHIPAVCPPLSLHRYLACPYPHEMRALGLPALVPPPWTTSPGAPLPKLPAAPGESGAGPDVSSTHEGLAPSPESPPGADPSISLSPSPPAYSSSEDDLECGIDLRGLARAVRREREAKRLGRGRVYRAKKMRKREGREKN